MVNSSGVLIRREVRSLTDDTLQWYAKAVARMKSRPPTEPTSWWYQAAIHGSRQSPQKDLYNQCKHGSWYFLAWHRMYVYYFEEIARVAVVELEGPDDWALPYWNYAIDREHAKLPDAFREPDDPEINPLYVKQRHQREGSIPGINEGAALGKRITSEAEAKALACTHFIGDTMLEGFGGGRGPFEAKLWSETGMVELSPHNNVHNAVGKGGWMADEDAAAADPIFWLHHGNIDRIWADWQQNFGAPTESEWLDQRFEFFDSEGKKAKKACREVLDTVKQLGYEYDTVPTPQGESEPDPDLELAMSGASDPEPKIVAATDGLTLKGGRQGVPVAFEQRAQNEVMEASQETNPRRLYLNIENIEGEKNPGTVYGVYVNLPENPDQQALDSHYAGSVSFFGIERTNDPRADEHPHALRYSLEVGDLLRALGGGERYEEEGVHVTFLPETLLPPEGEVTMEHLAIAEEPKDEPPVRIGRVSLSVR
jgi:tyrosinase